MKTRFNEWKEHWDLLAALFILAVLLVLEYEFKIKYPPRLQLQLQTLGTLNIFDSNDRQMRRLFRNIFLNIGMSTPVQPIHPGERFALIKLNMRDGIALVTVNKAYDNYQNKRYYAWLVGVELQIINKNENGHPIDQEAARLSVIQEELEVLLSKQHTVHSVARVTRNGFRDLLIYIDKPKLQKDEIDSFFAPILKEREVNFSIYRDPSWNAVSGFLSDTA